jgi:transcription-repair coupling factor (superfamily II helicase)
VDEAYVADTNQRLMVYRRLATARSLDEVGSVLEELKDRYGAPPASVQNLAEYSRIRVLADALGVDSIDRDGSIVAVRFRQDAAVQPAVLARVLQTRGDLVLLPPATLRLDLSKPMAGSAASKGALGRRGPAVGTASRGGESWWTTRASSGVSSGFTRAEITAEAPPDPAAEGGIFERLGSVLAELSRSAITG